MSKLGPVWLSLVLLLPAHQPTQAAPAGEAEPTYHGKTLKQWIELSRDGDPKVRLRAVAHLGVGPFNKAAVPALRAALKDNDRAIRRAAITALGDIGREAEDAVEELRARFKEEDAETCVLICKTLGQLGPDAVPVLSGSLKESKEMQEAALDALKSLGPQAKTAVPALIPFVRNTGTYAAIRALASISEPAVPAVIDLLGDPDPRVQAHAMDVLGEIGVAAKAAVSVLIAKLDDPNAEIRWQAAYALGRIGPPAKDAVDALIKVLKDPEESNRSWAAGAIGRIGPEARAAAPSLVEALSADNELASAAVKALGEIGEAALPALQKAVLDETRTERAVQALVLLGKAGGPTLKKALMHPDESIRLRALRGFTIISPEVDVASERSGAWAGPWWPGTYTRTQREAFRVVAPELLPLLLKWAKDPDVETRRNATRLLMRFDQDGEVTLPVLRNALKDKDEKVRLAAVRALEHLAPQTEAILALGEALRDKSEDVRLVAVNALSADEVRSRLAVPALLQALQDPNGQVRWHAFETLQEIGLEPETAIPTLAKALNHPNTDVRSTAIWALATFGPKAKATVAQLKELLADEDDYLCIAAARALWLVDQRADASVPLLIPYLADPRTDENRFKSLAATAAQALGDIGPAAKEAVPALIKALEKQDAQYDAIVALGRIGPDAKAAIPALVLQLGKHGNGYVATSAAEALAGIGPEALPVLVKALRDSEPAGRQDACQALTLMGSAAKPALNDVVELLYDPVEIVRKSAAECLAAIGPAAKPALPALKDALNDRSWQVQGKAVAALASMGPDAQVIALLQEALKHRDEDVRGGSAEVLGRLGKGNEAVASALLEAFEDPHARVRAMALAAYVRVETKKEKVVPILRADLRSDNGSVGAAELLWDVYQNNEGVRVLFAVLNDEWDSMEQYDPYRGEGLGYVGVVLKRMGPAAKEIVPDLLPFLKDKYGPHYSRAARLLKAIDPEAAKKAGVR